ncbi:Aste57867_15422 [Aphanomyces stellatus]|uniref:Aste57867_15422 protein n=1 Tax=Aphanomyces stellatus TaxID=120398 RepID=A0A485L5Z9_9STRA|nr:hypothetical protein As57867_015366 [Aphanomyces stellatus]VFT92224.1 Aste57867_15422 [Aphanomyces stellatus]
MTTTTTMSTNPSATCRFNECPHPAQPGTFKCHFHRHRAMCLSPGCTNQVYARNLCTRHGGKRQCAFEGCQQHARVREFCSRHGTGQVKKLCVHDGCTKLANARQRCVRHGGGRQCRISGCGTHARSGGYCRRHSKYTSSTSSPSSPAKSTSSSSSTVSESDEVMLLEPLDMDMELLDMNWMDDGSNWIDSVDGGAKSECFDLDCAQELLGSLEELIV